MIMAGRGKYLGEIKEFSKPVGSIVSSVAKPADASVLIQKINEINITKVDPSLIVEIHNLFKDSCTSKEIFKNLLSNFHSKAKEDADFGQKLVLALEQLSNFEVDSVSVRAELLLLLQGDFTLKDTMSKDDPKKFLNAVMLLGNVYSSFRVHGVPINVLGVALLEYFDLLLKGDEEELKALTTQILINGEKLSTLSQKYELLCYNIRSTLVNKNLNNSSKCWVLLGLEYMTNGLKPLQGSVRNFYAAHLGDDFKKLESLISYQQPENISSTESKKSVNSDAPKLTNSDSDRRKVNIKDIPKQFSDLKVTTSECDGIGKKGKDSGKKENFKKQTNDQLSDCEKAWGKTSANHLSSGHDDRFQKEENFYGVQMPRRPKPENQKKKT